MTTTATPVYQSMKDNPTPVSAPPVTQRPEVTTETPIFDEMTRDVPMPEPVDSEFRWERPKATVPKPGARRRTKRRKK
jgi:hypothetical protein